MALLERMTGAGLVRRLNYLGAQKDLVDPRSVEEILASGEFDRVRRAYEEAKSRVPRNSRRDQTEPDADRASRSVPYWKSSAWPLPPSKSLTGGGNPVVAAKTVVLYPPLSYVEVRVLYANSMEVCTWWFR
jgi:hypothetical protein